MVDNLLNLNNLFHLNYSFFYSFNHFDFGYFPDDFYESVNNLWHFNRLLNDPFNWNDLLNVGWYDVGYFQRNIHNPLHFLDLFDFNNLFNDFFNWDNLRHFDNSVNYLLNDLFNFNDFGDNSEDLEDVINVDNTHNFLVDHSNDSLINFQNSSGFPFKFFKFFQKGLNQNT